MSDTIALRGIRAYGRHGANPGERDEPQAFDLDVELECDLSAARASDALSDTIDYATLHANLVAIVETHSYELLERLGDELVREILRDPRVLRTRITLAKPALLNGATPSVTLHGTAPIARSEPRDVTLSGASEARAVGGPPGDTRPSTARPAGAPLRVTE